MKFVYVLEDDPKFQKEIVDAIGQVDPKIQVRLFPRLESFVEWIKFMMTTGAAAVHQGGLIPSFLPPAEPIPEGEAHQLVAVVSKVEYLGPAQLSLITKSRDLFVQRGLCTKEDPTAFVLTAFDDPNFAIRDLEDRIINNVIFKPFDRLILTQHLTFAIDGRHPPSKNTVTNQKTTAIVEMLKDVEMEAISDVGIVTKSYRPLEVGVVAKYYGKTFLSDRHRSLFAICLQCIPHPIEPKAFRCVFSFLAADQTQISTLRKKTRDRSAIEFPMDWTNISNRAQRDLHVVLLDPEENGPSGLGEQLIKRFAGVTVSSFPSFSAFMSDLDPSQALAQRDANLKALGGANSLILTFDLSGSTYLGFESDKKDQSGFFGVSEATLKTRTSWFSHAVVSEHKEKYRKYIQTQQLVEDNMLSLNMEEIPFLVKIMEIKKEGNKIHITMTEPGKDEQIQWLQKNTRLQKPVDLILASHRLFGEGAKERWGSVKETLKKKLSVEPLIMMTTKKDFTDAEERSFGTFVQDIFFHPVDRVYFFQKVHSFFPFLQDKEEKNEIKAVVCEEIIKAVNPVTVTEISEAGVVMKYYRAIALGSFREMILWQPYEIGAPELLATCNFVEENAGEKGTFNCHFVFFGINDHFLKHIRVWIRDNYVLSKEQSG